MAGADLIEHRRLLAIDEFLSGLVHRMTRRAVQLAQQQLPGQHFVGLGVRVEPLEAGHDGMSRHRGLGSIRHGDLSGTSRAEQTQNYQGG